MEDIWVKTLKNKLKLPTEYEEITELMLCQGHLGTVLQR